MPAPSPSIAAPAHRVVPHPPPSARASEQEKAGALRTAARDPALWGALGLMAALSLAGMATRSVWLDEAYSALLARRSLTAIASTLAHDSGPPLYYWLLRGWRMGFGESALALRSLSLVFALASAALVYDLGRILSGRGTARAAALLWATSPAAVFYAGEARTYTLLTLLTLVLMRVLWDPEPRWRWGRFLVAAVASLGLVYAHNMGWFAGAALLGGAAWLHRRRLLQPWLGLALLVTVAGFVPWIPTLLAQRGNISWVRNVWSPWSPLVTLAGWAPLGWSPVHIGLTSAPGPAWIATVALWYLPCGLALVRAVRGGRRGPVSLAVLVALGLALPWAACLLWQPFVVIGRHDLFLLPAVVLLVAMGVGSMRPRLGVATALALAALGIASILVLAHRVPPQDEREWTGLIRARAGPGDVILCTGVGRPVAEYYLGDLGLEFHSYPRKVALDLAHLDEAWYSAHVDLSAEAAEVVREATAHLQPGNRLWLVLSPRSINEPLYQALAQEPSLAGSPPIHSPRMGLRRLGEWTAIAEFTKIRQGG